MARLAALSERRNSTPATQPARKPTGSKRHHPAKGARTAALGLSLVSTGGLAGFFAFANAQNGSEVQAAQIVAAPASSPAVAATPRAPATAGGTPRSVDLSVPAPGVDLTPAPVVDPPTAADPAPAAPQTQPAPDVVVDGGVFHNRWGDVQVRATFTADGSLVDVATLQTPSRDRRSVRINEVAVPRLNADALASQGTVIDTVSGATYTSNDYRRSLQSAIDAASQAGVAVATA